MTAHAPVGSMEGFEVAIFKELTCWGHVGCRLSGQRRSCKLNLCTIVLMSDDFPPKSSAEVFGVLCFPGIRLEW